MIVRQFGKGQTGLGRPIAKAAGRAPDIYGATVVEQIAIAKAAAVGETASGRQRSQFRIKPFAIEDEKTSLFHQVHCTFKPPGLIGLGRAPFFFTALPVDFGAGGGLLAEHRAARAEPDQTDQPRQ